MMPAKLKKGSKIRVISPSRSLSIISMENRDDAIKRLGEIGLSISFSENAEEFDEFNSSSIKSRVNDIHEAFSDSAVDGILTSIGGFNSNQLLRYLDYDLIQSNPKVLCGYSDITALSNAIYTKTGLVTYSGPHFSTFGMLKGLDYTVNYFQKCLMQDSPFDIKPSKEWSDDKWYLNQKDRTFIPNEGFIVLNEGSAEGTIVGANLCTFNLLQDTEFMPSLKDSILFIEDDEESLPHHFDRNLQSLIHLPDFSGVKAIVIGRFQKASKMSNELLAKIIKTKEELKSIPIVTNVDFGHTAPSITFPIGGKARITASKTKVSLEILKH